MSTGGGVDPFLAEGYLKMIADGKVILNSVPKHNLRYALGLEKRTKNSKENIKERQPITSNTNIHTIFTIKKDEVST